MREKKKEEEKKKKTLSFNKIQNISCGVTVTKIVNIRCKLYFCIRS